jgi:hypothetical protein
VTIQKDSPPPGVRNETSLPSIGPLIRRIVRRIVHGDEPVDITRRDTAAALHGEVALDGSVLDHRLIPRLPVDAGLDALDERVGEERVRVGPALREALVQRHPAVGEPPGVAVDVDERADDLRLRGGRCDRVEGVDDAE